MLLLYLAGALGAAGQPRECRDTLHAALRLLSRDQPDMRAKAVATCALMERQLCRRAEGRALLREEISALPSRGTTAAAVLRFELACSELVDGDATAACDWAEQALAMAGLDQARPLQAAALGLLAMIGLFREEMSVACEHLSTAETLVDSLLDSELAERLDATGRRPMDAGRLV